MCSLPYKQIWQTSRWEQSKTLSNERRFLLTRDGIFSLKDKSKNPILMSWCRESVATEFASSFYFSFLNSLLQLENRCWSETEEQETLFSTTTTKSNDLSRIRQKEGDKRERESPVTKHFSRPNKRSLGKQTGFTIKETRSWHEPKTCFGARETRQFRRETWGKDKRKISKPDKSV